MTAGSTRPCPALSRSTNHIRGSQVLGAQEAVTKSEARVVANSGAAAAAAVPAGFDWPDGLIGYAHLLGVSLEDSAVSSF